MRDVSPLLAIVLAFLGGALVHGGTFPHGKNVPRFALVCCGITIACAAVTLAYR